MASTPLQRLLEDGYEAEVRQQHLLVHSVPYVTPNKSLRSGIIVCKYVESTGVILPPEDHLVWFAGEHPCMPNGSPIAQIKNESARRELFGGFHIDHRFSNKPEGVTVFSDHYGKVTHYIQIISDQARSIDPKADARTGRIIKPTTDEQSPFKYADTASVRSEIIPITRKLQKCERVAIIGLGGTGAYVLDQVAKTPVSEIHLYDKDVFMQHNAFRFPGAAREEDLLAKTLKIAYLRTMYEAMRGGIFEHPYLIDESNLDELVGFSFVFVCVDNGDARKAICRFLAARGIPFVDTGISVQAVEELDRLVATVRFTTSTSLQSDHIQKHIPMTEDKEKGLYGQNVQISELNAINAMFAVIKWKQLFGFYQDDFLSHHGTYSVSSQSLTRDVMTGMIE